MMTTQEKIKAIITAETNNRIDATAIPPDAALKDEGVDSLDMSSIFFTIEEEFKITIPNRDAEKLQTIGSIVQYIDDAGK